MNDFNFYDLPAELFIAILLYFNPLDVAHLMQANSQLYARLTSLLHEEHSLAKLYWSSLLKRDFPEIGRLNVGIKTLTHRKFYIHHTKFTKKMEKYLDIEYKKLFKYIRRGEIANLIQLANTADWGTSPEKLFSLRNDHYDCAISLASEHQRIKILSYFYQLACCMIFEKNKQDIDGKTQLFWAAACGIAKDIPILVTTQNINQADFHEMTPLTVATRYRHLDCINALLTAGADANIHKPIFTALSQNDSDSILALLAGGADISRVSQKGMTPLIKVANDNQLDMVKILLAAGANVNDVTKNGRSALSHAAGRNQLACMSLLLAKGADVNLSSNSPSPIGTALFEAARYGNLHCLQKLLAAGANASEGTALHAAACGGHLECVHVLLDAGALINEVDRNNESPLHTAACNGRLGCVQALVAKGANINLINNDQEKPIDLAKRLGHQGVYTFLKLCHIKASQKDNSITAQTLAILTASTKISKYSLLSLFHTEPTLSFEQIAAIQQCDSMPHDQQIDHLLALLNSSVFTTVSRDKRVFIQDMLRQLDASFTNDIQPKLTRRTPYHFMER